MCVIVSQGYLDYKIKAKKSHIYIKRYAPITKVPGRYLALFSGICGMLYMYDKIRCTFLATRICTFGEMDVQINGIFLGKKIYELYGM